MPTGISSIALFAPAVATNAVFSVRRASKGVDAISDNPLYGAMNIDIAAGQTLKGAKAVNELSSTEGLFSGAEKAIKDASKSHKAVKYGVKALKFTADHINPIICATSGIKVLTSDDKLDTLDREAIALTTMFAAEAGAKKLLGMPKSVLNKETGKKETVKVEGLYRKNPFLAKQADAIKDACETKKALKYIPGGVKGLGFVMASIGGFKLGSSIAESILGPEKKSSAAV